MSVSRSGSRGGLRVADAPLGAGVRHRRRQHRDVHRAERREHREHRSRSRKHHRNYRVKVKLDTGPGPQLDGPHESGSPSTWGAQAPIWQAPGGAPPREWHGKRGCELDRQATRSRSPLANNSYEVAVHEDPYADYLAHPQYASAPPGHYHGDSTYPSAQYAPPPPHSSSARAGPIPDGLVASSVPSELNTLSALNRHFRRFGEVLKITCHVNEGKAFVQFADLVAAQAAVGVQVLGNPGITLAWAYRPRGPKGGSKGKSNCKAGGGRPSSTPGVNTAAPENRMLVVTNSGVQRRLGDIKKQREDISQRRATLLAGLTEQMKAVLSKLSDADLSAARRDSLRALLFQIKEKMNAVGKVNAGEEAISACAASSVNLPAGAPKGSPGKAASSVSIPAGGDGRAPASWHSLDMRTKVLRLSPIQGWALDRIREALRKIGITDEQINNLDWEAGGMSKRDAVNAATHDGGVAYDGTTACSVDSGTAKASSPGGDAAGDTVLLRFQKRQFAEQVFTQRGDLPFGVEWCERPPTSPVLMPSPVPAPGLSPRLIPKLVQSSAPWKYPPSAGGQLQHTEPGLQPYRALTPPP